MHALDRRAGTRGFDIWPGFVDALSALLMVVIFVLMVFMVAQFYLSSALSTKDETLARLDRQLDELAELLDLERSENADLRARIAVISTELQDATANRDAAAATASALAQERQTLADRLGEALARNESLAADNAQLDARLADAYATIEADRETLRTRLAELASLEADIQALRTVRETLEAEVAAASLALEAAEARSAELATALDETRITAAELRSRLQLSDAEVVRLRRLLDERNAAVAAAEEAADEQAARLRLSEADRERLREALTALRDRSAALEERLGTAEERTVLAQREIEERDVRIEELLAALSETAGERDARDRAARDAAALVVQLQERIAALEQRLGRIQRALDLAQVEVEAQDVQIAELTVRLNMALAERVEELSRYRSEFFGRLREVLGERDDIRVVGDRFVFQSEVLFPSGAATLQPAGQERMADIAATLLEITDEIPDDIDWILRVDGHTDRQPISTREFRSNWELSTARAISVVRYLIDQGVPPDRLAATGFGEFQPIDPGDSDEALRRNRRIELKLDQR